MKKLLLIPAILASFFAASCTSEDAIITCDNYDYFLESCGNCSMTAACTTNYDSLPLDTQLMLDDCSDYMADAADNGYCSDWTGDMAACIALAETYLDMVCTAPIVCGDGYCEGNEDVTCPQDCPVDDCGDGECTGDENEINCAEDCAVEDICGDKLCTGLEDEVSCFEDCGGATVCDDYDIYLAGCWTDCSIMTTCEAEYLTLDNWDEVEDCADALAAEAEAETCMDVVSIDGNSCDIVLEEALGSDGECIDLAKK